MTDRWRIGHNHHRPIAIGTPDSCGVRRWLLFEQRTRSETEAIPVTLSYHLGLLLLPGEGQSTLENG